jgi:hypothetical protein
VAKSEVSLPYFVSPLRFLAAAAAASPPNSIIIKYVSGYGIALTVVKSPFNANGNSTESLELNSTSFQ